MRRYDFDKVYDRRNLSSCKWDVKPGELPLSMADMDLGCSDEIIMAIKERISKSNFGYTQPSDSWYESYIRFFSERHHFEIDKSWMMFSTGVVPTISSSVRKLTKVGDNVVVLSPVYNIFYNSIINNQRKVYQVPLLLDGDHYHIDFDGLEKAFALENTSMMIFCNPANPVSRIWTRDEIIRIGQLAKKYHVVVLSDEIHCELTRPGTEYVPYCSVNEDNLNNCVMAIAPTKSFNVAGIQTSAIVVANEELRKKVCRQINTDEVAEPNILSCIVAEAAFNQSRDWLDEVREYLFENRRIVKEFLQKEIPMLHLIDGDATYLLWIDVSKICESGEIFTEYLRKQTGLILNPGEEYGLGGEGFVRMNVAYPKSVILDALDRLKCGVLSFLKLK